MAGEDYARYRIHFYMGSGLYPIKRIRDQVLQDLSDYSEPYDVTKKWVKDEIARELELRGCAAKEWVRPTDPERLRKTFRMLSLQKIICLENTGYEMSDGYPEVAEAWYRLGADNSGVIGYCFFHGQEPASPAFPALTSGQTLQILC